MSIPAVVLGATGYVGGELLRLLAQHPRFRLAAAVSGSRGGEPIAATFPHLAPLYPAERFAGTDSWADALEPGTPLAVFSAAPHGASAPLVKHALAAAAERGVDARVVDASADFRYPDAGAWERVYGEAHGAPELLGEFCCALPEHLAEATARHVGHPGCFTSAVLLAAVPLVRAGAVDGDLYVCGTTGSTGSGRSPQAGTHHPERHSNLYAYKALAHRHAPEMEHLIAAAAGRDARVHFVPHSGPFARGIYVTLQARLAAGAAPGELVQLFRDAYRDAPFVQVVDGVPKLKDVVASNHCRIGVAAARGQVVVTSALDNLLKGAAGGAVQWMNRLFGLPETEGLLAPAPAWT
ncbi:MAG TPA: N-acetyl-gamma-glutamyl-phosphate reductase [Woeseiaceae bacterium]|nr:N-acetyl-gamma-glutamyl-phosphate reductase [Woeseiaceae bacterium]